LISVEVGEGEFEDVEENGAILHVEFELVERSERRRVALSGGSGEWACSGDGGDRAGRLFQERSRCRYVESFL